MSEKKVLFILAVTLFFAFHVPALCQHEGKARMKGTIKDTEGKPVTGVLVRLYSFRAHARFETKTDSNGDWKAMWIRSGKWNIDFEKTGYESLKISTSLKANAKIVAIDLTMKRLEGLVLKDELMKDFEKGNRLFSEKKFDKAQKVYEGILEKFPESYVINLNLGNCFFEMQKYEKAIQAYNKVIEKDATNTRALISIGNSYSNMNQTKQALEWYKKIEVAQIKDPVVLYNIGTFRFNAGDVEGAINFFKQCTMVQEDFLDGWYQLGIAYLGAGNNKAAIASFESFLKYDQDSEKAGQVRDILKSLQGGK